MNSLTLFHWTADVASRKIGTLVLTIGEHHAAIFRRPRAQPFAC
jgi:hypothetical protein